jgi:hypothetical protein
MGTMNFSIPDDVKDAFNATFAAENKSAIVADLMRKAVELRAKSGTAVTEDERRKRFDAAVKRLEAARCAGKTYSDEENRKARHEGRP